VTPQPIGRTSSLEKDKDQDQNKGYSLADICQKESSSVPKLLQDCVAQVTERGMQVEGIYRNPGISSQVAQLRTKYFLGLSLDLRKESEIANVAGLVKEFLRELPLSLVPFDIFQSLVGAYGRFFLLFCSCLR